MRHPGLSLSALQVLLAFHFCSAFICHPNILSWGIWPKTCSQTQEGKPEGTVLWGLAHICIVPSCPVSAGHHPGSSRGWGPAGQELAVTCRDSHSWAKHPNNLVSNSVSHSRTASGCQSSSGMHLAAVMPKTLKWWNNLLSACLLLNCGSFLRIKEHKYQQVSATVALKHFNNRPLPKQF